MASTPARLTDAHVAALARYAFGLTDDVPDLPPGEEWVDAEGVLVASADDVGLTVREIPRWRSPASVQAEVEARGWGQPATWVGPPPDDVAALPASVLALLPVGGSAPDAALISSAAAGWARLAEHGRETVVVPVPVTASAPEVSWPELAAMYGGRLLGTRVDPTSPRTGGRAVMFTGLSGAGKSTIASRLVELIMEAGHTVTLLDGDEVRTHLSAGLGFSRADRDTNVRRIGWVAAQIAKHGGIAVCAPIAPYAEPRADVRRMVDAQAGAGAFVLVHVATPLAECEARDRKGLYARARRGEIPEFTGISDPYEEPADAEITIDTRACGIEESARLVLESILPRSPREIRAHRPDPATA